MKRTLNILGIVALFVLGSIGGQLGIEATRAAFWQWSTSSSSNGNSDPTISWIEGMPPSVVNDSGRAMMARLAEQFADTSGALTTTGGPTAYTVATHQGFPNPPNEGMVLGITFNVDSGASPTLSADGGAAAPILSAPSTPATVTANVPYTMVYRSAGGGGWLVRGGGGGGVLGQIIPYSGTTEPGTSLKFANGQCISSTTYASYWVLVGSPAPGGCSSGQFAVLDLRGRYLAGLDNMGGVAAASRMTAATTGCGTAFTSIGAVCANGSQSHTQTVPELASHAHSAGIYDPGHTHPTVSQQSWWQVNSCPHCGLGGGGDFGGSSSGNINENGTGYTSIQVDGGPNGRNVTYSAGSSQPMPIVPPTAGVNYLIRVQ